LGSTQAGAKRLKLIAVGSASALALLPATSAGLSTTSPRGDGEPEANGSSFYPRISPDGHFLTFTSFASNLVAGDTNRVADVFVYDRESGSSTRISVRSDGGQGNRNSVASVITADGRFVAFGSSASNLVAGDTNGADDVFVHDRETGATARVSVDSAGAQARTGSNVCGLSGDGRLVVFTSEASNLVAGDTNSARDVFVHDRATGSTTRVSVDSAGAQGNGDSDGCALTADGRFVVFDSYASNLVAGDTTLASDVFVHDRVSGSTTRISVDSAGAQADGDSGGSSVSSNARFVPFSSIARNLVVGDTNNTFDVFVHDRQSGATTRESLANGGAQSADPSSGGSISEDGRLVVFGSRAADLVTGDTNQANDVFVHDREDGSTRRVSVSTAGEQANGHAESGELSGDGRLVVFESYASNLIPEDTNRAIDIFVHDLQSGGTTRVSGGSVIPRCRVPSLVGLALPKAKARISPANCSLGSIRARRSVRSRGSVLVQTPGPGADLPRDARINLVVSRGRRSPAGDTVIVFRCGEGYANLCGAVPESGELRQLTVDGDPHRGGSGSYVRFHRGYHGPSLSPDGRRLSFAFEGSAYIARQDATLRHRVGRSKAVGFTSIRPDRGRLALVDRVYRCIGSRETGSCRGEGALSVTTPHGKVLRRIRGIWNADWAGARLVASQASGLSLFSGRRFLNERVLSDSHFVLHDPAVSPDGLLVAVAVVGQRYEFIAVFSLANGKLVRRLTRGSLDFDPEWSPDGKRIVFGRSTQPCPGVDPCAELFTVSSNGRGQPHSLGLRGLEPTWGVRRK
jgi:Tol biopolymer transport system component